MANPQPDSFIRISREYHKALRRTRISGVERQLLDTIIFMTWGAIPSEKEMQISNEQFREETGLSNVAVSKAIKKLLNKGMITKNGNFNPPKYCIQKDYEKWQPLPKKVMSTNSREFRGSSKNPLPKMVIPVTKNGNSTGLHLIDKESKEKIPEVYDFYNFEIKPLRKSSKRAKKNIGHYLKKHPLKDLKKSILNYKSTLNGTEPRYRKDPANFFGRNDQYFLDYLPGSFESIETDNQTSEVPIDEKAIYANPS